MHTDTDPATKQEIDVFIYASIKSLNRREDSKPKRHRYLAEISLYRHTIVIRRWVHKTIRSVVCHVERAEKESKVWLSNVCQRVPTCAKCTKEDKQSDGNAGIRVLATLRCKPAVPSIQSSWSLRPTRGRRACPQIMELNCRETFLWAHATISS
jgi:hypothetical protein